MKKNIIISALAVILAAWAFNTVTGKRITLITVQDMVQDNMDFLDEDEERYCSSDYDIDSEKDIEYISIPAWRMKDGKLIAIRDMDTSHIKNCIKMIYRSNGTWRHQYLRYFEAELRKRKYLKNPPIIVYVD